MFKKHSIQLMKEEIHEQFITSTDFVTQSYRNQEQQIEILYISSIVDEQKIKDELIKPFIQQNQTISYESYLEGLPNKSSAQSKEDAVRLILRGNVAVFTSKCLILIDLHKAITNKPSDSNVENTIQGPQTGFSENISISLTQIRSRYQSSTLKVEKKTVGSLSQTMICMVYDEELVDTEILEILKNKLNQVKVDILQAAGQLEKFLNDKKWSLFPTLLITERPDRTIVNISLGKVAILIDGTPFAIVGPTVFFDFFSAVDDLYQNFWVSRFLVMLRYIGLFISLIIPALYVSIASYNPEVFRVQLAISIAGSRAAVPYPSFLEVLFMLGTMELLTEASLRLPKSIGSTATTVGGLILGQAAQQAGLVSGIMIIVVAAVAIANFVIPINAMSFSIRVSKYILIIFASLFGIVGVVTSFVGLIIYLCGLRSLGQPYLKLFWNEKKVAKVSAKESS